MNRQELVRAILWQLIVLLVACVVASFFGLVAVLSCALGGLCVAIPNTVIALNLIFFMLSKRAVPALWLLMAEILKLVVTCLLLVVVAKSFPGLNWLALISGIGVTALSSLALIFNQH